MLYLDLPTVALNIEAHVSLALAVRRVQLGNHFLGLHSRVFGKNPGEFGNKMCPTSYTPTLVRPLKLLQTY